MMIAKQKIKKQKDFYAKIMSSIKEPKIYSNAIGVGIKVDVS